MNMLGQRFGFIRFAKVSNEGKLERDLNSVSTGRYKLQVNIAKFKRDNALSGFRASVRQAPIQSVAEAFLQDHAEGWRKWFAWLCPWDDSRVQVRELSG
ncbi:hypothetical protein L1887_02410 [Cichorium endivia]|nr:hypothetical protein L1887_02410 [Cichorium endivia]